MKGNSTVQFGSVTVGEEPRVVGIVSSLEQADIFLGGSGHPCDLVEMRLDRMGMESDEWIDYGERIERAGYPVIATLRIQEEGGDWTGKDEARRDIFFKAMEHFSSIDIELRSVLMPELAEEGLRLKRGVIISFHDYEGTPSDVELEQIIERASANEVSVPKIAAQVNSENDIERLKNLLGKPRRQPICVIGMGEMGTGTRVMFPQAGSCLAYGHLGESTAPGQLPLEELVSRVRRK